MHPRDRHWLIVVTAIAVVCDSTLLPFYPRFFAEVYGVTAPDHVGLYIAATCLAVLLSLPLWAQLARRVPTLQLLVWTQACSALCGLLVANAGTLSAFWLGSLVMMVFKASYLLIYPLIMQGSRGTQQRNTIGLLSVVVHLGAIAGALLGGLVLEWIDPRHIFLCMALGDLTQVLVCLRLRDRSIPDAASVAASDTAGQTSAPTRSAWRWQLGLLMFAFYLAAFMLQPFFVSHWEAVSGLDSPSLSGAVYAIPALVALYALWLSHRARTQSDPWRSLVPALLFAIAGSALQAADSQWLILLGRGLFGWGLFQAMVSLDQLIFILSRPADYAADFSRIHIFQQLGALVSAYAAGGLVAQIGLHGPFLIGAAGLLITLLLYQVLSRPRLRPLAIPQTT